MGPLADRIAVGDWDGDETEDLLWSRAGDGVWLKRSTSMSWSRLTPAEARDMASGDMNGDGFDDLVGTWHPSSSGTYYKSAIGGTWVKMGPYADLVGAGDLDGDGTDDLLWSKAGDGVWVKRSSSGSWAGGFIVGLAAIDMDAGLLRTGLNPWPSASIEGSIELPAPTGGYTEGPGSISEYEDLSAEGPGGWNFVYSAEENLIPQDTDSVKMIRSPGPGESGFVYIEQENLVPQETGKRKKTKKN
jgi:hypothetical protein